MKLTAYCALILPAMFSLVGCRNHGQATPADTDTVPQGIFSPVIDCGDVPEMSYEGILPGCHAYRLSRHFSPNEHCGGVDFELNIAMPDSAAPAYIRDYINDLIRNEQETCFLDDEEEERIALYDIQNGTIPEMMKYYFRNFCRLYVKYPCDDMPQEAYALLYAYQLYVYPVWQSDDSTLMTWRFYRFGYSGGAHGGVLDYYLTFDNRTGRILGANDFFSPEEFKKATDVLKRQLNEYHKGNSDLAPWLDSDSYVTAASDMTINERIGGKLYPRPALVSNGVIFTYQTYEKGSGADGTLHFVQPYEGTVNKK